MKIYLASSWKNPFYEDVRNFLELQGHNVYDFKNPEYAFNWREFSIFSPNDYIGVLQHERCQRAFRHDMEALRSCNVCILLLPCGKSAHMEAGWARGAGKFTAVYIGAREIDPDLMHLMADAFVTNLRELKEILDVLR